MQGSEEGTAGARAPVHDAVDFPIMTQPVLGVLEDGKDGAIVRGKDNGRERSAVAFSVTHSLLERPVLIRELSIPASFLVVPVLEEQTFRILVQQTLVGG